MPIGLASTVTEGALNQLLGNYAVATRNDLAGIQQLWSYIVTLGANEAAQVTALQGLGFTAADAQAYWLAANNLFAVSQLYYGQLTLAVANNYDAALAAARGGS